MNISVKSLFLRVFTAGMVGLLLLMGVAFGLFDPSVKPFEGEFDSREIDLQKWQVDDDGTCVFQRVEQPARSGQYALMIKSQTRGRCEVLPWVGSTILGRQQLEPFNEDRWYAFSVFLPLDWEPNEQNEVVAQWHSSRDVPLGEGGGRGPPLALRVTGQEWRITAGSDPDLISKPGAKAGRIIARRALETGRWIDWVFRVRWSWKEDGITEVWMDGEPVVSRTGANAYFDLRGVYLKLGSYHPGQPRTLFLDRVRVQSEVLDASLIRR